MPDADEKLSKIPIPRLKPDTWAAVIVGLMATGSFGIGAAKFDGMSAKFEAMQSTISRLESKLAVIEAAGFEGRTRDLERLAAERGARMSALEARIVALEARVK